MWRGPPACHAPRGRGEPAGHPSGGGDPRSTSSTMRTDVASHLLTLALFATGTYAVREAWTQRRDAPAARRCVRGVVRHTRVAPGPSLTSRASGAHAAGGHHVEVEVEYAVGGVRFVHAEAVATLAAREDAERLAETRWAPGARVEVWHDPQAPERATVVAPAPVAAYLGVLGAFLLAAAVASAMGW